MARKLLIDYVICHKRHVPQTEAAKTANEEVAVYTYVGRVVNMLIAVYDDILSTGGTAIKALSLYDREGAEALIFIITTDFSLKTRSISSRKQRKIRQQVDQVRFTPLIHIGGLSRWSSNCVQPEVIRPYVQRCSDHRRLPRQRHPLDRERE